MSALPTLRCQIESLGWTLLTGEFPIMGDLWFGWVVIHDDKFINLEGLLLGPYNAGIGDDGEPVAVH